MKLSELQKSLKGIFPAVSTPLTEEGALDEKGLRNLVAHLLEGGVHGLWVLGSGGSFVALTDDQKLQIIRIVVEEVRGRIPILVGAGDCTTAKVIQNVNLVAEMGADAAFVVAPFYFFHSQSELICHYEEIALKAKLPIMIYNNPSNTKNGLSVENVAGLAKDERILGIKDSSCDFSQFLRLVQRLKGNERFRIFQGGELLVPASFLFGAHGAVFGLANVVPKLCVALYRAASAKDVDRLVSLQEQFLSLLRLEDIHGEGNDRSFLGGIQASLELMGICGRTLPKPFATFSGDELHRIESILKAERLNVEEHRKA